MKRIIALMHDKKKQNRIINRTTLQTATLKNVIVAPSSTTPYGILVCLARSSAESIGDSILSTVRKAAKLAV